MRSVWAAAFLLRRLRSEAGVALLIVLLVGVTSALFAGAPRVFNLVADEGLHAALDDASVVGRNVELSREFVVPAFDDPLAVVDRLGEQYLAVSPSPSARWSSVDRCRPRPRALRSRTAQAPDLHLAPPPGRRRRGDPLRRRPPPVATGEQLPTASFVFGRTRASRRRDTAPRRDRRLGGTAAEIGVGVGGELDGAVDRSDPLVPGPGSAAEGSVRGHRHLRHRRSARRDLVRRQPAQRDRPAGTMICHSRTPPRSSPGTRSRTSRPRACRCASTGATSSTGAPRRRPARCAGARSPPHDDPDVSHGRHDDPERVALRSGLIALLERHEAERAASEAVLSVAATGPILLAPGAFAMTAVLLLHAGARTSCSLANAGRAAACCSARSCGKRRPGGLGALAGYDSPLRWCPGGAARCRRCSRSRRGWARFSCSSPRRGPSPGASSRERRRRTAGAEHAPRLVLEATAVGVALAGIVLLQQRGLTIGAPRAARSCGSIRSSQPSRSWQASRRDPRDPPLSDADPRVRMARRPAPGSRARAGPPERGPAAVVQHAAAARPDAHRGVRVVHGGRGQHRQGQLVASWPGVGSDYRIEAPMAGTWPGWPSSARTASKRPRRRSSTRVPSSRSGWTIPTRSACSPSIRRVTASPLRPGASAGRRRYSCGTPQAGIGTVERSPRVHGRPSATSRSPWPVSPVRSGTGRDRQGDRDPRRLPGHSAGNAYVAASLTALLQRSRSSSAEYPLRARPGVGRRDLGSGRARSPCPRSHRVAPRLVRGAPRCPLIAVIAEGFRVALVIATAYPLCRDNRA